MVDLTSWIAGLMKYNYDAVGFIPLAGVREYVNDGDYIMQTDQRGNNVGYLLHGKLHAGGQLMVAQHCIETDKRLRGFGRDAFETLVDRAKQANCRLIRVKCAADLPSNEFWQSMGLEVVRVDHPANCRQRAINVMVLDLWPTLWKAIK